MASSNLLDEKRKKKKMTNWRKRKTQATSAPLFRKANDLKLKYFNKSKFKNNKNDDDNNNGRKHYQELRPQKTLTPLDVRIRADSNITMLERMRWAAALYSCEHR